MKCFQLSRWSQFRKCQSSRQKVTKSFSEKSITQIWTSWRRRLSRKLNSTIPSGRIKVATKTAPYNHRCHRPKKKAKWWRVSKSSPGRTSSSSSEIRSQSLIHKRRGTCQNSSTLSSQLLRKAHSQRRLSTHLARVWSYKVMPTCLRTAILSSRLTRSWTC